MGAWYPTLIWRVYRSPESNGTPSGPTNVVILVVDHISELTIYSVYSSILCRGNVQHFIYSELDAAECTQLV